MTPISSKTNLSGCLAVHGLEGDIRYGGNANYIWIQLFYSTLNEKGHAEFVMANSASDARASEQEVRSQFIASRVVNDKLTSN